MHQPACLIVHSCKHDKYNYNHDMDSTSSLVHYAMPTQPAQTLLHRLQWNHCRGNHGDFGRHDSRIFTDPVHPCPGCVGVCASDPACVPDQETACWSDSDQPTTTTRKRNEVRTCHRQTMREKDGRTQSALPSDRKCPPEDMRRTKTVGAKGRGSRERGHLEDARPAEDIGRGHIESKDVFARTRKGLWPFFADEKDIFFPKKDILRTLSLALIRAWCPN